MRIESNRGVVRPGASSPRAASSPSGFSELVATQKPAPSSGGLPVSPLANIIGITPQDPDEERRHRSVRYANTLLDDLEELHRAVCLGKLDADRLQALALKLDRAPPPADAEIADLIGQIQVRVAVELAKHKAA